MYNIQILEEASRELARLDKPIGRRIVERINRLFLSYLRSLPPNHFAAKLRHK